MNQVHKSFVALVSMLMLALAMFFIASPAYASEIDGEPANQNSYKVIIDWNLADPSNPNRETGYYDASTKENPVKYDLIFHVQKGKEYIAGKPVNFALLDGVVGNRFEQSFNFSELIPRDGGDPIQFDSIVGVSIEVLSQTGAYLPYDLVPQNRPHYQINQVMNTNINASYDEKLRDEEYLDSVDLIFNPATRDDTGKFKVPLISGISERVIEACVPLEKFTAKLGPEGRIFNLVGRNIHQEDSFDQVFELVIPPVDSTNNYFTTAVLQDLNLFNVDGTRLNELGLQVQFRSNDSDAQKYFEDNYEIRLEGDDINGWTLAIVAKNAPESAPALVVQDAVFVAKPVFKRKALDLRYARDDFYNENGVYKPVSLLHGPYKQIAE
ncbi:MAG: hypothetical protein Q4E22_06040 [Coriobacteriia bacterium]|nr:hypothetical protein [Coriobacteriia bacterium]